MHQERLQYHRMLPHTFDMASGDDREAMEATTQTEAPQRSEQGTQAERRPLQMQRGVVASAPSVLRAEMGSQASEAQQMEVEPSRGVDAGTQAGQATDMEYDSDGAAQDDLSTIGYTDAAEQAMALVPDDKKRRMKPNVFLPGSHEA